MRDLHFCLAFEFFFSVEMCNSNPTVYCDIIAPFVCCSSAVKWSIFSGIEHILRVQPFVCPWWALCILKHTVCPCKCVFLSAHEQSGQGNITPSSLRSSDILLRVHYLTAVSEKLSEKGSGQCAAIMQRSVFVEMSQHLTIIFIYCQTVGVWCAAHGRVTVSWPACESLLSGFYSRES